MKLEEQVCSLELAKRPKELGVKQEGLWFWRRPNTSYAYAVLLGKRRETFADQISAFTVAELGEMIPASIEVAGVHKQLFTDRFHDKWLSGYPGIYDDDKPFMDTEADSRAALLIYLLENNLVDGR